MSTPVNASARTRLSRVERRRQPSATAPAVASLFAAYSFRTRGSSTSSSSSSYSEPTKEITLDHPDLPGNPWTAPPDADLSVLSLSMNARLSSQALLHGNPHTIRPTLRQEREKEKKKKKKEEISIAIRFHRQMVPPGADQKGVMQVVPQLGPAQMPVKGAMQIIPRSGAGQEEVKEVVQVASQPDASQEKE
ncbi:hypothetical protein BDZ45DRAFT_686586 [Acephala macrosclerotiorum]|nr:hypothetical protein BDZ45DRAFT_686586 [Acephala macrosclerotiorum]